MKNILKEALELRDIPKIREILIEIVRTESGSALPLETITRVVETTPGLFDPDDGKTYSASPFEMSETLTEELERDIADNFSIDKFRLLTEVYAIKAEKPDYFANRELDKEKESAPVEELTRADFEGTPEQAAKRMSVARAVGYVILALGCAAAIVGLCVPVKFLLGLGIGVFLLGTAVVYMNIAREPSTEQ